jgi:hypothetical protein
LKTADEDDQRRRSSRPQSSTRRGRSHADSAGIDRINDKAPPRSLRTRFRSAAVHARGPYPAERASRPEADLRGTFRHRARPAQPRVSALGRHRDRRQRPRLEIDAALARNGRRYDLKMSAETFEVIGRTRD